MRNKIRLIGAALLVAAAFALAPGAFARGHVSFGVNIGLPGLSLGYTDCRHCYGSGYYGSAYYGSGYYGGYYAPAPVYYAPAPVYYGPTYYGGSYTSYPAYRPYYRNSVRVYERRDNRDYDRDDRRRATYYDRGDYRR